MTELPRSIEVARLYLEMEIGAIRSHLKDTALTEKQQGGIRISRLLEFLSHNSELARREDTAGILDLLDRAGENIKIGCFTDARNHVNEAFLLICGGDPDRPERTRR